MKRKRYTERIIPILKERDAPANVPVPLAQIWGTSLPIFGGGA